MIAGWKGLGIGVKTACAAALGLKSEAATRITALRSDKKLRMEGATEGISLPGEGIACPECEAQKAWVGRRFVPQAAADAGSPIGRDENHTRMRRGLQPRVHQTLPLPGNDRNAAAWGISKS
jgi:hypothetical protein